MAIEDDMVMLCRPPEAHHNWRIVARHTVKGVMQCLGILDYMVGDEVVGDNAQILVCINKRYIITVGDN